MEGIEQCGEVLRERMSLTWPQPCQGPLMPQPLMKSLGQVRLGGVTKSSSGSSVNVDDVCRKYSLYLSAPRDAYSLKAAPL